MRIISRGSIPEEKIVTATCKHCLSMIEFERREAKEQQDRDGLYLTVTCPVCSRFIHKAV